MTAGTGDTRPDGAGPPADPELDALMERLRTLARIDDPPPLVDTLARAAFETRYLDAELAVLVADSAVDQLALVRSADSVLRSRMVSFETDAVGIELEIRPAGATVDVRGLITGIAAGKTWPSLELETGGGRTPLTIDPHGWFRAADIPVGMLRVRLSGVAGGPVATPWISTRPR